MIVYNNPNPNPIWSNLDPYGNCTRRFAPYNSTEVRFPKYGYGELLQIPPADNLNSGGNYINGAWTNLVAEVTSPDYETLGFDVKNITNSTQLSSYKVDGETIYFGPQSGPDANSIHLYTGNNSSYSTKVYRYRSEGSDLKFKFLWLRIETKTRQEAVGPDCVREVFIVDEDMTGRTYTDEDDNTINCSDQEHHTTYYFLIGSSPNFEEAADITLPYGMPAAFTDKFPVIGIAQGDNSSRPNEKTMTVSRPGNYMLVHNRTQNTWTWHINKEPIAVGNVSSYISLTQRFGARYNWRQSGPPQQFYPTYGDDANCTLYSSALTGIAYQPSYGGSGYQGTGSLNTWQTNYLVSAGSRIKTSSIDSRLGLVFVCKRTGGTGATEPSWPTIPYREDNGTPLEGFVEETPVDSQGQAMYAMPFSGVFDVGDKIKINYQSSAIADSFELTVATGRTSDADIAADLAAAAAAGGHTSIFQTGVTVAPQMGLPTNGFKLTAIDGNTYSVSVDVTTSNTGAVNLEKGALWAAESAVYEALVNSAPSAIIELYELTLIEEIHGSNQVFYFYPGQTSDDRPVVWRGISYVPLPVKAEGFEYTNTQLPRPVVTINNLDGTITALMNAARATTPNNDLNGAKFIRRRTMAEFLDAATWPAGSAPSWNAPSPDTEFPMESYVVDRKVAETREFVQFELTARLDLQGVRSPKRQCIPNICQWTYRSGECSYNGAPVADENDTLINSVTGSALGTAFYTAKANLTAGRQTSNGLRDTANQKLAEVEASGVQYTFASSIYQENVTYVEEDEYGEIIAVKDKVQVTLGQTYRKGDVVEGNEEGVDDEGFFVAGLKKYKLETYQQSGGDAAKLAAYAQAQAAYDSYNTQTLQPLITARDNALNAWKASPTFAADVAASGDKCGKLLSSCKLRFKDTDGQTLIGDQTIVGELPFGSYPGVGTFLV